MFSAHRDKNRSHDKDVTPDAASVAPPPKTLKERRLQKVKTLFEKQTRAAHDLGELLRLKTKQKDRYWHVLDLESNLYLRHQMVQSFLWMQLSKEKDNPGLNRQSLARIVAQSFNGRAYTGRKIIHLERSFVKSRVIPSTKAGFNKHNLSWMEDEDLVLSVKEWSKKARESKVN